MDGLTPALLDSLTTSSAELSSWSHSRQWSDQPGTQAFCQPQDGRGLSSWCQAWVS